MAINEQIFTGKKFRVWDTASSVWKRFSWWTKASDVELNNGNSVETEISNMRTAFQVATCATARNVAAKVVTLSGFNLVSGSKIAVRFTDTSTTNPESGNLTLNVNNTGVKTIVDGHSNNAIMTYSSAGYFYNNMVAEFIYDGTYWVYLNRDYNSDSKVTQTISSTTNGEYRVLMSATADDTTRTEGARKDTDFKYNPSTNILTVPKICVNSAQDASGTTDNKPALIVGGASTSAHMEIDANEIMAKSNGTTPSDLYLNIDGGNVRMGGGNGHPEVFFATNSTNTPPKGTVQNLMTVNYKNADGSANYSTSPIAIIGTDGTDTYNAGISIGSKNGTTYVSAGESATALPSVLGYNDENLYATADGNIQFITNAANDGTTYNKALLTNNILSGTNGVYYATCATAAGTAAKVATISNAGAFKLVAGVVVYVTFTGDNNTASNCTLNVNSTGAKQIWYNTGVNTGNTNWLFGIKNATIAYLYDGTYWRWINILRMDNSNTVPSAYCDTAAATAAKVASCTGYSLLANSYLHITLVNSNSSASAITLNVNGKGAKPIYINGSASSASNYTLNAGTYIVYYNGTNYYFRTDGKITGAGIVDIGGNTTKYLRGDGTWQNPPGTTTGTTYAAGSVPSNTTFATNGTVKNVYDALYSGGEGLASRMLVDGTNASSNGVKFWDNAVCISSNSVSIASGVAHSDLIYKQCYQIGLSTYSIYTDLTKSIPIPSTAIYSFRLSKYVLQYGYTNEIGTYTSNYAAQFISPEFVDGNFTYKLVGKDDAGFDIVINHPVSQAASTFFYLIIEITGKTIIQNSDDSMSIGRSNYITSSNALVVGNNVNATKPGLHLLGGLYLPGGTVRLGFNSEHTGMFSITSNTDNLTDSSRTVSAQDGDAGSITGADAVLSLQLNTASMYILFCSSYTVSSGAIYGATTRLITAHGTDSGTPNNVSLGQTSNAPATITMTANNIVTIKNGNANRATQYRLIRVL